MHRLFKPLLAATVLVAGMAHAAFPERPITIVVPYAPGGAADTVARLIANGMATKLGTSIVVENKAGASGAIGAASVAKAKADGYTMLYDATPHSINPHMMAKIPYSKQDLQPLSLTLLSPNVLIVKADSPLKNVNDLIELAKNKPHTVNFASGGSGTVQRLASELFRQQLKLDMTHIPYKSGGPAIADVVGGQVNFMFGTVSATYPLIEAGKLRALAVSSPQRSPRLPAVPTVAETVIPGYEAYEWHGMFLPAGTPDAIVQQLHQAVSQVIQLPEIQQRFKDLGAEGVGSTPAEFAAFLKKEDAKWGDVVLNGQIKAD